VASDLDFKHISPVETRGGAGRQRPLRTGNSIGISEKMLDPATALLCKRLKTTLFNDKL